MSLGAYIRERLFGEDAAPRKTRGKFPVKDHEALGRVLAALGSSRLSSQPQPARQSGEHGLAARHAGNRGGSARSLRGGAGHARRAFMALGRGSRDEPGGAMILKAKERGGGAAACPLSALDARQRSCRAA